MQRLRVHAKSYDHQQAVAEYLIRDDPANEHSIGRLKHFLQLLTMVRRKDVSKEWELASRFKVRRMIWALAEAIRFFKRDAFRKASQAALHHDGSDNRLICRFSLSDAKGRRLCGFLSLHHLVQRYSALNAVALAQGLCHMVEEACTRYVNVPDKSLQWHKQNSCVDLAAQASLVRAVSMLDADAASDERGTMRIVNEYNKSLHVSDDMHHMKVCLLYTSPSPRDATLSRMPSSA